MKREILEQLQADRAAKRPVVLATFLKTGEQRLLYLVGKKGLKDLDPRIGEAARAALIEDKPRTVETEQGPLFLNVFNPPLRLILVGAVHIAQALVPMAQLAGYEVIENSSTNRMSDFILASEGFARATVREIPAKDEKIRPNWLPFVRVESVSQTVSKAKLLGGKVLIEPKPEVFGGKVAVVADPTGAAIGVLEWSAELAKGAH